MAKRRPQWEEVPRGVLEHVANIIGQYSAAADALKDADAHDGPVRFYRGGNTILVEKLPKQPPAGPSDSPVGEAGRVGEDPDDQGDDGE